MEKLSETKNTILELIKDLNKQEDVLAQTYRHLRYVMQILERENKPWSFGYLDDATEQLLNSRQQLLDAINQLQIRAAMAGVTKGGPQ